MAVIDGGYEHLKGANMCQNVLALRRHRTETERGRNVFHAVTRYGCFVMGSQAGSRLVVAVGCLPSRSGCDNNACLARWVVTQNEVPNNVARPVFGRPRLNSNIPICLAVALALGPVAMAFKLPALDLICNHGNHAAVLLPHRLHGQ